MQQPSEASGDQSIAGRDATVELDPHHLTITYEDKLHGEADELEVELRDDVGL